MLVVDLCEVQDTYKTIYSQVLRLSNGVFILGSRFSFLCKLM